MNDLLCNIEEHLNTANAVVSELEKSIAPIQAELRELQQKIKYVERVEEISQQVHQLKKKLAWSWVYDVDKQLEDQNVKIAKLKDRIPACQAKIDFKQVSFLEYQVTIAVYTISSIQLGTSGFEVVNKSAVW